MPSTLEPDQNLPPLREDLHLFEGARDWEGAPTWTIFDPLRNRYFQIGEVELEVLNRWGLKKAGDLVDECRADGIDIDLDELKSILDFLVQGELVETRFTSLRGRLSNVAESRRTQWWRRIMHQYLFFRVPLVRPQRFLERVYPLARPFFTRTFLTITVITGILGLSLAVRHWSEFVSTLPWLFSVEGMLTFGATLVTVKIIHELGHALTCQHYGLRVPTMGVAFLVMWPVLYTDASEAWRLQSRRQRALIDSAGVLTELALACYATLLWVFLPDGVARSLAFTVATTTWVFSLMINLNPFMRFDGYYFLADTWNIPNLQERSFVLAKWQIRRWLFGSDEQPPERFPPRLHRWVVTYAIGVWVYRFFLFLGIAVLVYNLFFKVLGILLFAVEIWWFIVRPIVNEVKHWRPRIKALSGRRLRIWLAVPAVVLFVLLFPWRNDVTAPAVLDSEQYQRIYAPRGALVEQIHVNEGSPVSKGDPLVSLRAPELTKDLETARLRIRSIEQALERSASSAELFRKRLVMQRKLARARSSYVALLEERERLEVKAPLDGRVRSLKPELHTGRWVNEEMPLMTVVGSGALRIQAWVREKELAGLEKGERGRFFAEHSFGPMGLEATIEAIESSAVTRLESPYHASVHGGALPVRRDRKDKEKLVPEVSLIRVHMSVDGAGHDWGTTDHRLRGWVKLKGARRPLIVRLWRWVSGTLIRESGF